MPVLPQQPRNLTEILSASFKLYTESFTKVIGYSLIMFVVNKLLTSFILDAMPAVDSTLTPDAQMEEQMAAIVQIMPSLLVVTFVAAVCSCIFYSAMIYRIDNVANGRADDFVEVLLLAVKKFPAVILAGILYTIAITVGTFLLVIPGIILMISLMFFWYFILLEGMNAYDSLMASHRLVWGDWWRTNIVFFVPGFIFFIILLVILFFGALITDPNSNTLNTGSELLGAFATPYFYALIYLQYHDLKLRKNM
ncbi:MAG: hypothetical protein CG439_1452 [Methylococcaceae bacterium NSP1-2]|nr:hypothetical protein [Methylococcaceae bacterium]OYV18022.1 MAG: hypothetical protein CG439_1452 [Methylococcaceae bacterium NSP1-2]